MGHTHLLGVEEEIGVRGAKEASPVGHPGDNRGGETYEDASKLLGCSRAPAVAVRETPHETALSLATPALGPTLQWLWAA